MSDDARSAALGNTFTSPPTFPDKCQESTCCAACGKSKTTDRFRTPPDFVDQSGAEFSFDQPVGVNWPVSDHNYRHVFSGGLDFCVSEDGCRWPS